MSLGQELAPHLPFLRRYARALTGSQAHGDAFVRATSGGDRRPARRIPARRRSAPRPLQDLPRDLVDGQHRGRRRAEQSPTGAEGIAQARLSRITPLSRQALLLTSLEGFSSEDTAYLIGASPQDVDSLVAEALEEIERQTLADVLIIEDEPIIAMDIETIVRDLGHNVTGVAVTRDEAVAQARQHPPGLVLADIQLADDSSGIDAVKDILAEFSVPVIFITAFPGAAADRDPARADLPDHQAVPALDGEGRDRPGPVLRRGDRSRRPDAAEHGRARRVGLHGTVIS